MGLFDSLFGSSSSGASTNSTTTGNQQTGTQSTQQAGTSAQQTNQSQSEKSNQSSVSNTTQQQATTNSGVVSTLDPATQALLTGLLPALQGNAVAGTTPGGDANVSGAKQIAQDLYTKATVTDQQRQDAATLAATDAAKLQYQTGEGAQVAGIAQQIGSSKNSYSQLIANKGKNDLATQIADIAARGNLAASSQESQDLSASLQAISGAASIGSTDTNTAIAPLLDVISALKGANTTSSTTEKTAGSSGTTGNVANMSVSDLIASITGQTSQNTEQQDSGQAVQQSNTNATQSGNATPGIVQSIFGLF